MSHHKTEADELHAWLQERMKEANLAPSEITQFSRWLMSLPCEHPERGHGNDTVSFSDVLGLISWLKVRMNDLYVRESERAEFSHWLAGRLLTHDCLSDEELRRLHEELSCNPPGPESGGASSFD